MRLAAVSALCAALLICQLPSTPPVAAQDDGDHVGRVLALTNIERHTAGLKPLVLSEQLSRAAQTYSRVLATSGCFEHSCGPTPKLEDRAGQAGYTGWDWLGENIAAGAPTPEAAVSAWMSSPSHRAIMLSPKFNEIGVGLVRGGGKFGSYWTQEFGSRPDLVLSIAQMPSDTPPAGEPAVSEDTSGN